MMRGSLLFQLAPSVLRSIFGGEGVAIGVVRKVTRATVLLNKTYTKLLSFCLVGDAFLLSAQAFQEYVD